jgi:phosphoglycolate phosphatase-like HAD superfamily hydrolase
MMRKVKGSTHRTAAKRLCGHSGPARKLWIFDFDNTIARLEPEVDWEQSRRELEPMLREAGVPEDLFVQYPRGNLLLYDATRTRLLALAARNGSPPAGSGPTRVHAIRKRASAIIERYELEGVGRARPLEGAIELLGALRRSAARIAIVTSNSSRTVRRWLERHHLGTGVVDAIVGRDSLLALKPSPEMLERALEISRAKPADAAVVGDSDADFIAASALGIEFFAIGASEASRDRLARAGAPTALASPAALAKRLYPTIDDAKGQ